MSTYQRVKEGQAARRRGALKRLALAIVFGACAVGGYQLLQDPRLSFGAVYVTGADKLRRDEVLFLAGLTEPVNLFLVGRGQVKDSLLGDLRIKEASVGYELPNILHIDIKEKEAFCYIMSAYGYALLDETGLVLGAGRNIKDAAAPVVSGLSVRNEFVGDRVEEPAVAQILSFLGGLDESGRKIIAEINISPTGQVRIFDLPGRLYIMGDIGGLGQKTKPFSAIAKELSEKNLSVEFVNLSYSKPYIKIKRQEEKKAETERR